MWARRAAAPAAEPAASNSIATAANPNTTLQPNSSAISPLSVRESSTPSSSPLITVPTTFPRSWGAARCDDIGTTTWPMNVATPTSSTAVANTARSGATAEIAWPTARQIRLTVISLRRSTRSPSGTRKARPST